MARLLAHARSNVVAYLALFVALGGSSYAAANLPADSVGPKQLKADAVRSPKVKDGSLLLKDLKAGQAAAGPGRLLSVRKPVAPGKTGKLFVSLRLGTVTGICDNDAAPHSQILYENTASATNEVAVDQGDTDPRFVGALIHNGQIATDSKTRDVATFQLGTVDGSRSALLVVSSYGAGVGCSFRVTGLVRDPA